MGSLASYSKKNVVGISSSLASTRKIHGQKLEEIDIRQIELNYEVLRNETMVICGLIHHGRMFKLDLYRHITNH